MQIGFIGAGRVGVSLGKYLKENGSNVAGYYSLTEESARWAARFTNTTYYDKLQSIISDCDMLIFTVPDDCIAKVWEEARSFAFRKIIANCSGLHSSNIFSDRASAECSAYSIHPLCAVSSKEESYRYLKNVLFTIEGDKTHISTVQQIFEKAGNRTCIILAEDKARYHAAASLASNHMTAIFSMAEELLMSCGFSEEEAREELFILAKGNLENIREQGCVSSLTGPIERGDEKTVRKHLQNLPKEMKAVYQKNGMRLLKLAEQKHPEMEYGTIKKLFVSECREAELE